MNLETIQPTTFYSEFTQRLEADGRHPALVAEDAIRCAIQAAGAGDARQAHEQIEFAKHAIISRRCGMEHGSCDLMATIRSPGLALCSGLSNVSEMVQAGRLDGIIPMLAEAAMRAHALAN